MVGQHKTLSRLPGKVGWGRHGLFFCRHARYPCWRGIPGRRGRKEWTCASVASCSPSGSSRLRPHSGAWWRSLARLGPRVQRCRRTSNRPRSRRSRTPCPRDHGRRRPHGPRRRPARLRRRNRRRHRLQPLHLHRRRGRLHHQRRHRHPSPRRPRPPLRRRRRHPRALPRHHPLPLPRSRPRCPRARHQKVQFRRWRSRPH
jgi:hypothetical protein